MRDPTLPRVDDGQAAAWEHSLGSLLKPPASPIPGMFRGQSPLAIELTIIRSTATARFNLPGYSEPPVRAWARLVQPGKNGGWIAGQLSWARLEQLRYTGEHSPEQVQILSEFLGMYRSSQNPMVHFGYGGDRSIDLTRFESRQLWAILDEAASVGVRLVQPGKHGQPQPYRHAEFSLDVTAPDPSGPLRITPVLAISETNQRAGLLGFIGTTGHGVLFSEEPAAGRYGLAKLSRPVPAPLQRMAMEQGHLEIPADALARFRDGYYLRLRQLAAVTSSDGSFVPPQVSGPVLTVRAHYGLGHDVEAGGEWVYRVGDTEQSVSLAAASGQAPFRDLEAEQAILADLGAALDRFGLLPDAPGRSQLTGLDTMRFTTELLPLLADREGVRVDLTGEPADYREVGDTLRIGVSVDEQPDSNDWFDLGITIIVEGRPVPFVDVFTALARGQSYLLLDDGAFFSLDKPELRQLARLIEEARALGETSPLDPLRISRYQAGLWEELAEVGVVSRQAAAWERQVAGLLSAHVQQAELPPPALRAQLRPYQLDGYAWLSFLYEHRLGGILADDMGLGKTLQCLALLNAARKAEPDRPPFLIVAPTSVVPNWAAECGRFAPDLRVICVTETAARRGQSFDEVVADADAIVVSYALLRIDFEGYAKLPWSGLILDEAQNAKNHQSKIYQCARRLPAPFKLAITGTPMENNLMELWSLLSITAPGLFPHPQRFRDYYAKPIEYKGDDHLELLAQLRRRIRPLVLRRTKEQVAADLPAKQEQVLEVDLHPKHRKLYQTQLQRERQKVLRLIDDDPEGNRFTILRSLTLLRQLALHGGLIDDDYHEVPSAKIDTLLDQLRDVAGSGHRALVFSQFTGFLAKVKLRLALEGIPYCYLDGGTRDRAGVLASFKEGTAPVFLISLKAGGFGLNLTEADYCFLLDPWWNPAVEAQAIDRTHRIGQTRNVMVYRLIAKDTIEEKVMALAARKADLFTSVLDEGNLFGSRLSADDIRQLFS
ncbi:MAG TPA: SNF2-related protein [Streptosporangiaceae bacterium]|nr:SNF2-related protein [Streptosporangiaceae bacterium]